MVGCRRSVTAKLSRRSIRVRLIYFMLQTTIKTTCITTPAAMNARLINCKRNINSTLRLLIHFSIVGGKSYISIVNHSACS